MILTNKESQFTRDFRGTHQGSWLGSEYANGYAIANRWPNCMSKCCFECLWHYMGVNEKD